MPVARSGCTGPTDSAGIFMSIFGAIVVLLVYRLAVGRRTNDLGARGFASAAMRVRLALRNPIASDRPIAPYAPYDRQIHHDPLFYPQYVSPAARCAFTTSGFSVMPNPGLSLTWMKPSLMYGPSSTST